MQINIPVELKPVKNGANELFKLSKLNGNFSAMYNNGVLMPNTDIDESIFYWLVNSKSALNSWAYWTTVNNIRTVVNGDENYNDNPIILQCSVNRCNKSTQNNPCDVAYNNVNDNWASTNTQAENISGIAGNFALNFTSTTCFSVSGNTPLLYKNNSVSETLSTSTGHFSQLANIYDFNYNGILLEIWVCYNNQNNTTINYCSLADYINNYNNSDNYICGIRYNICFGSETLRFRSADTNANGSYFISGNYAPLPYISTRMNTPTNAEGAANYTEDKFLRCSPFTPVSYSVNGTSLADYSDVLSQASGTKPRVTSDMWEIVQRTPSTVTIDFIRLKKSGAGVYNDDDFNKIRREIAYLGFWFSDGTYNNGDFLTTPLGENATDDVYMSEIKNGITTGKFIKGSIAKDTEQAKAGTDWRDKIGYNGKDTGNKDRGNLKTTIRNSLIPTNTKDYAMTGTQLQQLITWCNSGFTVTDSNQFLEDFKGLNPADCVISAMYFPFDVGTMATATVHVGNLDTGLTCQYANMGANYGGGSEFTYSPLTIDREYNDFRDYAPYTTIEVFVPFCGVVSLNPADVYGYDITVTIIPDLMTGACTGCIYRGEYLLGTIDGKIGMPISLSLGQVGDYQNAVTQAQFNLKNANRQMFNSWLGACASVGAMATGAGAAVGFAGFGASVTSMFQAQENIKKAEYNLDHIARNFNTVGSVSDTNTVMVLPEYVHAIIKRPYPLDTDINAYAHTVGYACNVQGNISDFSGYTVCSDIDVSGITATNEELELIKKYCLSGIIL